MADWAVDSGNHAVSASAAAAAAGAPVTDEIADRTSVITGRLKSIYRKTVLPVEKKYRYDYFYESPLLTDVEFDGTRDLRLCLTTDESWGGSEFVGDRSQVDSSFLLVVVVAKPQVMLIGQYSVGKTSFIRYLLGRDFPGQRIGPEPTTDRFTGKYRIRAANMLAIDISMAN
jgi:hypothetical protein